MLYTFNKCYVYSVNVVNETEKCEFCCCRRKWIIRHCPRVQHLILKSSPYLPSVAVMTAKCSLTKHQETVKSDPIGLPLTFQINYGSPQTFIQSEVGAVSSWETGKAILGAPKTNLRLKNPRSATATPTYPDTSISLTSVWWFSVSAAEWDHLSPLLSCQ